jgi:hypothetical protein
MKNIFRLIFSSFLILFIFNSCFDLSSCNSDISGKYFCYNDKEAINFIDINENGTFFHSYKKGTIELISKGTWEKSIDGYCYIELSEWKNFNEEGKKFKEFGNGILYIDGDFLNISPDGESSTSFSKK